jgi:DNA-directed RNA polymerase specialized sigma24 family protein
LNSYIEHIDYIFKDNPFLAEVMKLKMLKYRNKEIAEELDCKVSKINLAISKVRKNKKILSELFPNCL